MYLHVHVQYVQFITIHTLYIYTFHSHCIVGLDEFGWIRGNGQLQVVCKCEENQKITKDKINYMYILRGCKSRTGCTSNRCKCKKMGAHVGQAANVLMPTIAVKGRMRTCTSWKWRDRQKI